MIKICAWCEKFLVALPGLDSSNPQISHGICLGCREIHYPSFRSIRDTTRPSPQGTSEF